MATARIAAALAEVFFGTNAAPIIPKLLKSLGRTGMTTPPSLVAHRHENDAYDSFRGSRRPGSVRNAR
jgi:hypothetical protein